ncbi:MAG TPA: oxaloacetate decarboxylase [Xanthobacteraceae bacterium]|jgi:2-methylisocitrate lyase-like PEP mutase family enzyme|nr:oxaloacetate decarboxylase [Xanthobacteraceae bacterium]
MADYATLTCPTMKHQAMTSRSPRRELRDILVPGAALLLPGVANALAARVVADQGFAAAYVTGAGIANTFFGVPDIGLVTVSELAAHVAAIREAFAGPLVVDADTGFGNAVNVVRTVQLLERAGADALQIEDQVFPKRCGHFAGKEVIPAAEMVAKIKAAVDTRHDPDLLIIARTDAIAPEGFAAALERAAAYREAGADVTFVEAPTSMEEIAEIPRRLPFPQLINIVIGGRTPELPNAKLKELGYAGVIYANLALQSALKGMQAALGELRRRGHIGDALNLITDFSERQRLVHKDEFDALERKYVTKD